MGSIRSGVRVVAAATAAALVLAACGSSPDAQESANGDGPTGEGGQVTITIGDLPSTENQEARDAILAQIEEFQDANPDIVIEAQEVAWAPDTFQAILAGGTMPTVLQVPFTEINSLMDREQVADLTDYVDGAELLGRLNPALQDLTTDADGRLRGVPHYAYEMGLVYNRGLFTEAGLDPDDPPTTWDEVRAAAQAIEANTDAQGFAAMTTENTGGWALAATSYAFGGAFTNEDGTQATVDNEGTKAALEFYRTLRWEDDVMGDNFLRNQGDWRNDFAAGRIGIGIQGADSYFNVVVTLGMPADDYGVAPAPQTEDGLGVLVGGSIAVVNPTATPEQIEAAVTWMEYRYFAQYFDEEIALTRAAADRDAGVPIGRPALRALDSETWNRWLGWIDEYVDVPREHFEYYLSGIDERSLVPEPARGAQELYAALDSVVQAVLTREDADIDQLLADVQGQFQTVLDAANG